MFKSHLYNKSKKKKKKKKLVSLPNYKEQYHGANDSFMLLSLKHDYICLSSQGHVLYIQY